MEKSIEQNMEENEQIQFGENFTQCIWQNMNLKQIEPKQMSPLVLAYIGDGVYDLVIRTYLLSLGNMPVNKINHHACKLVKAQMQSKLIGVLEEQLTPNELAVYKRGRNAKSYTAAKNATIGDYRRATGFEALMGYLYLDGQYDRLTELVNVGLKAIGEKQ